MDLYDNVDDFSETYSIGNDQFQQESPMDLRVQKILRHTRPPSLKLTFSHLKMDGWNTCFVLGPSLYRGANC